MFRRRREISKTVCTRSSGRTAYYALLPVFFLIGARILPDPGYAHRLASHLIRGWTRNLDGTTCPSRSNHHLVDQRGSYHASGSRRKRLRRSSQRFDRRSFAPSRDNRPHGPVLHRSTDYSHAL